MLSRAQSILQPEAEMTTHKQLKCVHRGHSEHIQPCFMQMDNTFLHTDQLWKEELDCKGNEDS